MEKLDYRPSLKNVTRHWVKCIFSDETENHKYDYSSVPRNLDNQGWTVLGQCCQKFLTISAQCCQCFTANFVKRVQKFSTNFPKPRRTGLANCLRHHLYSSTCTCFRKNLTAHRKKKEKNWKKNDVTKILQISSLWVKR